MILASIRAKPCPTQFLGPAANGKKCRPGANDLVANRSGLNSFTSFPQISSLWWIARTGIHIDSPFGITRSPSFMSSNAIRGRSEAGGYSLSDSLITMFNCNQSRILYFISCWCSTILVNILETQIFDVHLVVNIFRSTIKSRCLSLLTPVLINLNDVTNFLWWLKVNNYKKTKCWGTQQTLGKHKVTSQASLLIN